MCAHKFSGTGDNIQRILASHCLDFEAAWLMRDVIAPLDATEFMPTGSVIYASPMNTFKGGPVMALTTRGRYERTTS